MAPLSIADFANSLPLKFAPLREKNMQFLFIFLESVEV